MLTLLWNPFEIFKESVVIDFYKICLAIDSIVYNAIAWIYSVFTTISSARLFDNSVISAFYSRIYMIISVIMLFVIAYSFLQIIINPDMMSKGNLTPLKIVTNVIFSLLCIVFMPVVFNFAYSVQNAALDENIISKVILGVNTQSEDKVSGNLAIDIFETQFYPVDGTDCKNLDMTDFSQISSDEHTYCQADWNARRDADIGYFSYALGNVEDGSVKYNIFLCFIVGVFVLYVLVVYVFDIALRTVKLAFYQLIAPIPSLLLIVPGQDKVFKSWLKEVIKTFLEVFLKSAILLFGVYLISLVRSNFNANNIEALQNVSGSVLRFSQLFIFLGIVMFIKQAPKLLSDIFGIKLDSEGFSLRKRLRDSGLSSFFGGAFGMGVGAAAGIKGALEGADARGATGRERKFAALSGAFHGARLGRAAGASGNFSEIGSSYKYAQANQAAWAHMDPRKGSVANWLGVQGEMLRDNFGFPSYYDSLIATKEIEYNSKNSGYNRAIQSIDEASKQKMKSIEDSERFDVRTRANDAAISAGKDIDSAAEEEVLKDGYTETTSATILVRNEHTGKLERKTQEITGSQIDSLNKIYSDALKSGEISATEQVMYKEELDAALKRLKSNYITNSMMTNHRDNAWDGTSLGAEKVKYASDFVSTMKSSLEYKEVERLLADATRAGNAADMAKYTSDRSKLEAKWKTEAESRFDKIVANPSDYKTNLSFVNKVNSYNDIMHYSGDSAVGVDKSGAKVSADIIASESGSELLKSIKAVKNANAKIEYDKNETYRKEKVTYVDENGSSQTILLTQAVPERTRLSEASKKLTEELKDFKMAHADEEQFAKIAQERKKFVPKHRAGGKKS